MKAPGFLARTLPRFWLRNCDAVGDGARIDGRPWIENRGGLTIGARLRLASRPVQSHLVVGRGAALHIGNDVAIGHGAAIAAHACVRIGHGTRIGPFAVISDTDFHVAGRRDAPPETTPVVIGSGVRLGARVTVLRGSSIADGARVIAGSVVSGAVAADAVVGGVPARPFVAGESPQAPAERVPLVVATALGLSAAPPPELGPGDISQWDSLGSLRLLLALEDTFGVTLDEAAMARVRRVSDLIEMVDAARKRTARPQQRA